jgi:hypothetical protein
MVKVIDNKPYNGHTNWATWNVMLWLDNDEGLYKEYRRLAARRRFSADSAEEFVKEWMPSGTPDFDSPAEFSNVDWDSIAENMNEGFEDEENAEEPVIKPGSEVSMIDKFIERYQVRIAKQERTDHNPKYGRRQHGSLEDPDVCCHRWQGQQVHADIFSRLRASRHAAVSAVNS